MWLLLSLLAFAEDVENPLPKDFVSLSGIPGLILQNGYATPLNFTGAPLPGYEKPGAWLRKEAAASLNRILTALQKEGYGLVVFDAYRPVRASEAMVIWADATGHTDWVSAGYVARWSEHSKGSTVDVGLTKGGKPVEMGSGWDEFGPSAGINGVTGEAQQNRWKLRNAMSAEGWLPYDKEWWHFRYPIPDLPYLDIGYADPPKPPPARPVSL